MVKAGHILSDALAVSRNFIIPNTGFLITGALSWWVISISWKMAPSLGKELWCYVGPCFASEITLLNFRQTAWTLAFYLFLHGALLAGPNLSGLFCPNLVGHPFRSWSFQKLFYISGKGNISLSLLPLRFPFSWVELRPKNANEHFIYSPNIETTL